MKQGLIISLVVYLFVMLGLSLYTRTKIHTAEDFVVAGRKLPLWLSVFTLMATWFGAGTLLVATDEVYHTGIEAAFLEPFGAGCALLFSGFFMATKLWNEKILTTADFFKSRYGKNVEYLCVISSVLGFGGWIAVQLVALSGVLYVFTDLPVHHGIWIIALLTMGYTLMGGMWSVALTDFVQLLIVILGLILIGTKIISGFPSDELGASLMSLPIHKVSWLVSSLSMFLIASLGNTVGQDLCQRIFSANSAKTAKRACLISGVLYIGFGAIPVAIGLYGAKHFPGIKEAVVPVMAKALLDPWMTIVFVLAIFSAVLSTIDSGILAPATVIGRNFLRERISPKISDLTLYRSGVFLMTGASLLLAYSGEKTYTLLEQAYAIGLSGFFAPMMIGLYSKKVDKNAGIAAITVGICFWSLEFFVETELPIGLIAAILNYLTYYFWVYVKKLLPRKFQAS